MADETAPTLEDILLNQSDREIVADLVIAGRSHDDLRVFAQRFESLAKACSDEALRHDHEESRAQEFRDEEEG